MTNREIQGLRRLLLAIWLGMTCVLASAQTEQVCEVQFIQNGMMLKPVQVGRWLRLNLAKAPFEISVKPASCRPMIAALTSKDSIFEVASLTDTVLTDRGHGYAATDDMSDILLWPSREPIKTTLEEMGSEWSFVDSYMAESARLGYKPQPIHAWGSSWPFKAGSNASQANFRRVTANMPLAPEMPDYAFVVVIYLTVKELTMANNSQSFWYLSRPYLVTLSFK